MAIELLMKRWSLPGSHTTSKIVIDDGEDGDGGVAIRQFLDGVANQTVDTALKIDSITGRVRWTVGGQTGTWRAAAGSYEESITAAAQDDIALVYDAFTVAQIDEETLSVAIPED